jgi:hypothetical protein
LPPVAGWLSLRCGRTRRAPNSNGSPPTDGPADFVALRCWLSNRRRTQSQSAG